MINITEDIIQAYTHGMCHDLAIEINHRTGLPIYGIRDIRENKYVWGYDYWHFFVRVNNNLYIDCSGLHTGEQIIQFWSKIHKDDTLLYNSIIEPVPDTRDQTAEMTKKIAEYLIHTHIK